MTSGKLRMFEKEKYSSEGEVGWQTDGDEWSSDRSVPTGTGLSKSGEVRKNRWAVLSCTSRPHKRLNVCQDLTGAVVCLPSNSTTLSPLVPAPGEAAPRSGPAVASCVSALADGALVSSAPHGFCCPICRFIHVASPRLSVPGVAYGRPLSLRLKPSPRAALLAVTIISEGEHGCWVGPVSWAVTWVATHSRNNPSDAGLGSLWTF